MTTLTKYFQFLDLVRYASAVGITSASSVLLGGVLLNINYYNCGLIGEIWRFRFNRSIYWSTMG